MATFAVIAALYGLLLILLGFLPHMDCAIRIRGASSDLETRALIIQCYRGIFNVETTLPDKPSLMLYFITLIWGPLTPAGHFEKCISSTGDARVLLRDW